MTKKKENNSQEIIFTDNKIQPNTTALGKLLL